MKRAGLFLLFLCSLAVSASDTAVHRSRPQLEFQVGQAHRPYYSGFTPKGWETVTGYYFSGGWEGTLGFTVPVGTRLSFGTRWKQGSFGPEKDKIAAIYEKEFPDTKVVVGSRRWRISQLNTGLSYTVPFKSSRLEVGQYMGVSILKVPYLQVRVYKSPYTEVLIIRQRQKQSMFSMYTTAAYKYHYSPRRYVFVRGELAMHFLRNQRIQVETVFGTTPPYERQDDDFLLNYSASFGVGWNLGKR